MKKKEFKERISQLEADKRRLYEQACKLEDEVHTLRSIIIEALGGGDR